MILTSLYCPVIGRVGDRLEYDSNSASRLGAMTGAVCYGSLFGIAVPVSVVAQAQQLEGAADGQGAFVVPPHKGG